jgi:hypothetical protein
MTGQKTGGRSWGTPNKVNSTLRSILEEKAGAPIPVLLLELGLEARAKGDLQLAVLALSKAAPYAYGRAQPEEEHRAPPILILDDIPALDNYPGPLVRINTKPRTDEGL